MMTINLPVNNKAIFAEQTGSVYTVQIARGDKMNALTDAMYGSLIEQIDYAENNDSIKVILLRSDNQHFCAGNDLKDFLESTFDLNSNVVQFLKIIARLKKPFVCAVGGAVVGIGTTLLLHCDLVYAAKNSQFSLPFIKLSLTPEGGSSKLLEKRCGTAKANDWLLTGRTFDAQEALESGLVNGVYSSIENTWKKADEIAQNIAQHSLQVLVESKALLKGDQIEATIELLNTEATVFARRLENDESKAAFKAFLNRA